MKTILLQDKAINSVNAYIRKYKSYYQNLYEDTGLFGLERILGGYEIEAEKRREDIYNLIYKRLSEESVYGRTIYYTLQIRYKSKIITLYWKDENNMRIVTDIEIC